MKNIILAVLILFGSANVFAYEYTVDKVRIAYDPMEGVYYLVHYYMSTALGVDMGESCPSIYVKNKKEIYCAADRNHVFVGTISTHSGVSDDEIQGYVYDVEWNKNVYMKEVKLSSKKFVHLFELKSH